MLRLMIFFKSKMALNTIRLIVVGQKVMSASSMFPKTLLLFSLSTKIFLGLFSILLHSKIWWQLCQHKNLEPHSRHMRTLGYFVANSLPPLSIVCSRQILKYYIDSSDLINGLRNTFRIQMLNTSL